MNSAARKGFLARNRASVLVTGSALGLLALAGGATVAGSDSPAGQHSTAAVDPSEERAEHKPLEALGPNPYDIGLDPTDSPDASGQPRRGNVDGMPDGVEAGVAISSAPGLVLVDTFQENGEGMGTGMVLSSTGEVLTNYHVVEGSERIQVKIAATGATVSADLVGRDSTRDVALLQLKDAGDVETVSVSQAAATLGETVYAVGNGNGQGFLTRLKGTVTAVNQSIDVSDVMFGSTSRLRGLIQTDADVIPGYSGGPLLDARGQVVGLTTAASAGPQVDGFATPILSALDVVEQIRSGHEDENVRVGPKGALGVQVSSERRVQGAPVVGVTDGSPAAGAGIGEGDVITVIQVVQQVTGGTGDQLDGALWKDAGFHHEAHAGLGDISGGGGRLDHARHAGDERWCEFLQHAPDREVEGVDLNRGAGQRGVDVGALERSVLGQDFGGTVDNHIVVGKFTAALG